MCREDKLAGSTGTLYPQLRKGLSRNGLRGCLCDFCCSNIVETFDAEDAGDFADVGGDAFELLAVGDFQSEVDAGVQIVGMAAEGANVRAGLTDDGW